MLERARRYSRSAQPPDWKTPWGKRKRVRGHLASDLWSQRSCSWFVLNSELGWRLLDARPDRGWLAVGFDGKLEFCNPAGFIQGGILTAMLDDTWGRRLTSVKILMGPAAFMTSGGKFYTTTISLTVNFLAPAKPGPLTAEAQVIQLGKSIAFMEGKLMDQHGAVLALATTTARLIEAAKALR